MVKFMQSRENVENPIENDINKWKHYCHTYNGSEFTVFKSAKPILNFNAMTPQNNTVIKESLFLGNKALILGNEFLSLDKVLRGSFAGFTIWTESISQETISKLSTCQNVTGITSAPYFTTDQITENSSKMYEISNVWFSRVESNHFCKIHLNLILFDHMRNFENCKDMCEDLGESLYIPRDEKETKIITDLISKPYVSCSKNSFVFINIKKDENNIWRNISDNSTVSNTYFSRVDNINDTSKRCAMIKGSRTKWRSTMCSSTQSSCAICQLKNYATPLSLRGMCFGSEEQTLMDIRGYINGLPYFHGIHGKIVHKHPTEEYTWDLTNYAKNQTLARISLPLNGSAYPIGRHWWKVINRFCTYNSGEEIVLNIDPCGVTEFTCDNFDCIPLDQYCNGYSECGDSSDEISCVKYAIPDGYIDFRAPENNLKDKKPTNIDLWFWLVKTIDIDDISNVIKIEFKITFKWIDPRLEYFNLNDETNNNQVHEEDLEKIWKPRLRFTNLYDGQINTIKESCQIQKTEKMMEHSYNSVEMSEY